MRIQVTAFIPLLSLLIGLSHGTGLVFKMTNAVCESHNKSWVIIETCRLHALQRNKTILNVYLNVLHPTNSVSIRMQVQKKANGYKPWVFDTTFDACKFMKDKSNKAVKVVFDLFKEYSSLDHPCPYVGQQYLRGFYPAIDKLRLPLPTGDYLLLMTWKFYNRIQLETNVYFTFVEDF
ncbi:uncharacterized protein LOC133836828 [Drosophila sulfurigaster albostrigata]|uniref:uncharacterized protein LOC133836828 n=1 Tax=Drosophila sulfurigaster albostrigata TaxID=89887 RepID=UPI002D21A4C0|nr:uncharacterized protein LOC133836828 [Drosophila sulfurigaster albostrigata]